MDRDFNKSCKVSHVNLSSEKGIELIIMRSQWEVIFVKDTNIHMSLFVVIINSPFMEHELLK